MTSAPAAPPALAIDAPGLPPYREPAIWRAQVAELVDALVSGTSGESRGGSSPLLGTSTTAHLADTKGRMTIRLHRGDLPALSRYTGAVAVDTETMGLEPHRDRLCVVQLSPGDGTADVVQIPAGVGEAPNLTKLLADGGILKIFHFARFDLGVLQNRLAVMATPVYCTKIASRLARTYTDKHGLKDL